MSRRAAPGGAPATTLVPQPQARRFGQKLRRWFRQHGRDLPWRRTRDPYAILVSELMLQQTQVSRVLQKYPAFLDRFPSLDAVAAAPIGRVMEAWAGLGYYARARNLHKLAVERAPEGCDALPSDAGALRALPGIGAYTAGAVSSFAYERRAALVDTNVARVLRRVFAPHLPARTPAGARILWQIAEEILPRRGSDGWTHNQALMELGALVCTARVARCGICPVRRECGTVALATASGPPGDLPLLSQAIPARRGAGGRRADHSPGEATRSS